MKTTLMTRIVVGIVERLVVGVPEQNREAFRSTAVIVIEDEFSRLFGGEALRMYVPKLGAGSRRARDERIAAAVAAGDSTETIAQRESITSRRVRQVRGRIGG